MATNHETLSYPIHPRALLSALYRKLFWLPGPDNPDSKIRGYRPVVVWAPVFDDRSGASCTGWKKQKAFALLRDGYRCQAKGCGHSRLRNLTVHHIIPREAGGTDNIDNLITLCKQCHEHLHSDKIPAEQKPKFKPPRQRFWLIFC